MNVLRLLPVLFAFLLLGAHFLRADMTWGTVACLALPLLLLVRRPWVAHGIRIALLAGGLEWLRTTVVLVASRRSAGEPWTRLAVILGAVVAFTMGSALVFGHRALRKRYRLDGEDL